MHQEFSSMAVENDTSAQTTQHITHYSTHQESSSMAVENDTSAQTTQHITHCLVHQESSIMAVENDTFSRTTQHFTHCSAHQESSSMAVENDSGVTNMTDTQSHAHKPHNTSHTISRTRSLQAWQSRMTVE